jgi:hypothetical protein
MTMRMLIRLKYKCRWCQDSFESGSEYLDNFVMYNRLHKMHICNVKEHDKNPDIIPLRTGVGDLVGYTIVGREP